MHNKRYTTADAAGSGLAIQAEFNHDFFVRFVKLFQGKSHVPMFPFSDSKILLLLTDRQWHHVEAPQGVVLLLSHVTDNLTKRTWQDKNGVQEAQQRCKQVAKPVSILGNMLIHFLPEKDEKIDKTLCLINIKLQPTIG